MSGTVAVVGGGITGLAAAHRLAELGVEAILLERSSRCGGMILTEEVDGFLVEGGPDSFVARKPWAAALCRRVGLEGEIIPTDPDHRGSFILHRGRLHPLPEGLSSLVPTRLRPLLRTRLLSPAAKARLMAEPLLPRGRARDEESLAGFFRRRLGAETSRRLVEPLVRGIYGGDPETLSLRATFPQLADIAGRHRSLILALVRSQRQRREPGSSGLGRESAGPAAFPAAFLSLSRGMGSLVDRLVDRLPIAAVRTGTQVEALHRLDDGRFQIVAEEGGPLGVDAVVLAVPAAEASILVRRLDRELSDLLGTIQAGSSLTVSLGFDRESVGHTLDGYGFVVPESEASLLLACTWSSSKFRGRAPSGTVLLRAFLADPRRLEEVDDRTAAELALRALRPVLRIDGRPRMARVHRWRNALPRYSLGHPRRVQDLQARAAACPGLFLAGASYSGIGIPDCVRDGESAAQAAHEHVVGATSAVVSR